MAIKIAGNRVLDYDGSSGSNTNIAVGHLALTSTAGGLNNTAVGTQALYSNVTGANNLAVGYQSLYLNDGNNNTAVGKAALYDLTTGSLNTVLGWNTGLGITTGEKNTIIGANVTGLSSALSNTIILADGDGNQRLCIISTGNVGMGTLSPGTKLEVFGSITARAATTQDSVILAGRAGGTGGHGVTLTPTTLTAARTVTLADGNTTLVSGTMAVTGGTLAQFAATTSAQLAGVISDETGTGALVFGTSPTFTTGAVIPLVDGGTAVSSTLTLQSTSGAGTSDVIIFKTASQTERMRITTAGNVGIGTTSPAERLDVAGAVRISSNAGTFISDATIIDRSGAESRIVAGGSTNANLSVFTAQTSLGGAAERLRITSDGNVGIGTTSPSSKLSVVDTVNAANFLVESSGTNTGILVKNTATGGRTWQIISGATASAASPGGFGIQDSVATAARFFIDSTGNVGIGTTSPGAKLHASMNATTPPAPSLSGTSLQLSGADGLTNRIWMDAFGSGTNNITLRRSNGTAAAPTALASGDILGFMQGWGYAATGYAPGPSSQIRFVTAEALTDTAIGGIISFWTTPIGSVTSSEKMRIDSAGNVGIGTTSPVGFLHVYGTSNSLVKPLAKFESNSGGAQIVLREGTALQNWMIANGYSVARNFEILDETTSRLIIQNSTGRVGINTTAPVNRFTVLDSGTLNTGGDTIDVGATFVGPNYAFGISGNAANFNVHSNSTLGADVGATIGLGGRYTGTQFAQFAIIKGAKENATDGNYATYLAFGTRANGGNIAERMRIDSAGNVGIGTASPASPLQIQSLTTAGSQAFIIAGDSNAERMIIRSSGATGGTPVILLAESRGTQASPTATQSGDVLGYYQFGGYNGSSYFRSAWIYGLAAENYTAIANGSHIVISTTPNGSTSPSERMRIDKDGNVGIGTASPGTKLHIETARTGSDTLLKLSTTGTGVVGDTVNIQFVTPSTGGVQRIRAAIGGVTLQNSGVPLGALAFYTTRSVDTLSEAMRIDDVGNVGIGTTSPAYPLDVVGVISSTVYGGSSPTIIGQRAKGTVGSPTTVISGDYLITLGARAYNGTAFATTSKAYLSAKATETWTTTANGTSLVFATTPNTTISAAEVMIIDNTGNVGIGTASPGQKLHVVGNVMIDQVSGEANLYMGSSTSGNSGKLTYDNNNINFKFSFGGSERMRIDGDNNLKVGGSAARATTAGTNQVVIYNGTAPVGTLASGCSFYSTAGEMRVMDAAGNATLLSPHDNKTNEWIYDSAHTPSGKRLKINVEKLLRFINDHFGLDCVHDFIEVV